MQAQVDAGDSEIERACEPPTGVGQLGGKVALYDVGMAASRETMLRMPLTDL